MGGEQMERTSHAARWWSYITRAVILGAILVIPTQARAVVVYDFSGQCIDVNTETCSGDITGVLTLTDAYTPGNPIAESSFTTDPTDVFLSFLFMVPGYDDVMLTSSDYALISGFTMDARDPIFNLPPRGNGPLPSTVGVPSLADVFVTSADGFMGLNNYTQNFQWFVSTDIAGHGENGMWTLRSPEPSQVPEPSTLMLLGIGLAGLRWMGRRRKND